MPILLNGENYYLTAEACDMAGTNRNTLLRWIRSGLFADAQYRDRNGWRLFTEDDIQRLRSKVYKINKIGTS